jgi:hypothetical protein
MLDQEGRRLAYGRGGVPPPAARETRALRTIDNE